jgi:Zn-dependent metalloprotease
MSVSLAACNGGSSGSAKTAEEEIEFDVPPQPASFTDGSENNQEPPAELLIPEFVPLAPLADTILDPDTLEDAEEEALTLVRQYMQDQGFSDDNDVGAPRTVQDEYGRIHVKFPATYKGLPVTGSGIIAHLDNGRPAEVTDNLVAGIEVSTDPRISQSAALDIAKENYPLRAPAFTQFLAVLPVLALVNNGSANGTERAEDFAYELADSRLVWEIVLTPPYPKIDDLILERINNSPSNDEPDDQVLADERDSNLTHGGHDAENKIFEEFVTTVDAPPILFRIDGITGEIIEERVLLEQGDWQKKTGSGYSYFNGRVELDTILWNANNRYYLIDNSRPYVGNGLGNTVWDADNQKTHDTSDMTIPADFNNSWGDSSILNSEGSSLSSTRRQTPAVDVAFAIQTAWDMFDNVLYRNGFDGSGGRVNACVHYDNGYSDAHYNRSSKLVCFGDNDEIDEPGLYDLPWVGHELGHNFWHAVGNASEDGESSALNEGHGDIMGSLVDFYRNTANGKGNRISHFANLAAWQWRLVDPEDYDEKEGDTTYKGRKYWSSTLKDIPEHVGGIPFGRAFVYLAEGAPVDSDNTLYTSEFPGGLGGIGITRAAHIWKHAVAYEIIGTPTYAGMRTAFLQAAKDLYGFNSMEYKAVKRAFAAIRVGDSVNDLQNPEITYAKIFGINLTDMTAKALVYAEDDTGIRQVNIDNHRNNGVYMHDGYAYGYVNISRPNAGQHSFSIGVEDSDGKTVAVNRSFTKARNRNLITNGDFEDGMDHWTSFSGNDRSASDSRRAFIGDGYLAVRDNDGVYQEVSIPASAENVKLVFRLLIRNSADEFDSLTVTVMNTSNQVIGVLDTYTKNSSKEGRSSLNKGYLRQEFDLSAYAGQTARIAFSTIGITNKARFVIDQVVMTYTEEAFVDDPEVTLREWENTVSFHLPMVSGIEPQEVSQVHYYVDGEVEAISERSNNGYYASVFLHRLGPGPHWVGAIVRGLDSAVLAQTNAVWFVPKPFTNELLVNGGFEDGFWDWFYSDVPPKVDIVEDFLDSTIAFDGEKAMKMGNQGGDAVSVAAQVVKVPKNIKSLDFSIRIKVTTGEGAKDASESNDDELVVELLKKINDFQFEKISEHHLAYFYDIIEFPGTKEYFAKYFRANVSLSPGLYSGKDILVRLKAIEYDTKGFPTPTTFYVDNASLRYSEYGLQINP